jgi:NADP-dependent 3-hydroxy acid dehydrogenase YdfG
MSDNRQKLAVVTGASSGIGAATARALSGSGFKVVVCARRMDRLQTLAREIGATACFLDVASPDSIDAFCSQMPDHVHLLVNNAGGALGLDPIANAKDEDWIGMFQTNVLGLMRVTRALLPRLAAAHGPIINVT